MLRRPRPTTWGDEQVVSARHHVTVWLAGILAVLLAWVLLTGGVRFGTASAGGSGPTVRDSGQAPAGRHFVAVTGGGDTAYLAAGTTSMSVPPGTVVSFDPLRLSTSLGGACPRWDFMARFGGRSVGDTRVVAGTWTRGGPALDGAASYHVVRPEPMRWYAACYDEDGRLVALPFFTAHIEFLTATPFS